MKILAVGPAAFPITGQSVAFHVAAKVEGVSTILINSSEREGLTALLSYAEYWIRLILIFLFRRFDICYFTCSRTLFGFFVRDLPLVLLMSIKGVKIVNHLHGADFIRFRMNLNFWMRWLLDSIYAKVDTSIVLLPAMKEQFATYPNMRIEVISNFYDQDDVYVELVRQKVTTGLTHRPLNILFLSSLVPEKGLLTLLEAFEYCVQRRLDIHLDVAGSGSESIVAKINWYSERTQGRVQYHGVVEGIAKQNLLLNADVVSLPTYYETEAQPIVLIEGMAFGCALHTSRHNYIPNFISSKNGVLVDPLSVESVSQGLYELCRDKASFRFIGAENLTSSQSKYSINNYKESLLSCFRGVLSTQ